MSAVDRDNAIVGVAIQSEESCRCFSIVEILSATNKFDDALVIGIGGFGKVYKGYIDNGATTVAIKRLNAKSKQGAQEFWTEVKMLSKLRHTNLVALIGHCDDWEEMILVYEYLALGNLADHLYRKSRKESGTSISHLTWEQRLNVCVGAARGLDYLHTGTDQSFIHRDVKTTNILLDSKWVAKISDLGLSKGTTSHSTTHVSTNVKGTFGYLDPDYFYTNRLTEKSDVYAFGVVLLEVLCGRLPVDSSLEEEQISLVLWAGKCVKKGKLGQIIDPSLSGEISPHSLKYFVEVVNNCIQRDPKQRPTMAEVVRRLELALASQSKGRMEGKITKLFHGIIPLPKGMNCWWIEEEDNGSKSGPSKDSCLQPHSDNVKGPYHSLSLASPKLDDVEMQYQNLSFAKIQAATENFDESFLIEQSRSVYKCSIDEGTLVVAVKRLKREDFTFNVPTPPLRCHPNILSLRYDCWDDNHDSRIMVYDYMANGSLKDHIYKKNDPLTWEKRLEICIDAARGLQYLHIDTKFIPHYIKASKILLDKNCVAKVTDLQLDLSRCFELNDFNAEIYVDPKLDNEVTPKSDVYSFGVMLLEILCCRRRHSTAYPGHDNLISLIKGNIIWGTMYRMIDPNLKGKIAPECLREFVKLALRCVLREDYKQRPSMNDVLGNLQYALQLQKASENKKLPKNGYPLYHFKDKEFVKFGELEIQMEYINAD